MYTWRGKGYLCHRETEFATAKDEKYSDSYKAGQRKGDLAKLYSDFKDIASQMFSFDAHTPPILVYNSLNDTIHKLIKQKNIDTKNLKHNEVEDMIAKAALELWKIPYIKANHIQPGIKKDSKGNLRDFSKWRYEDAYGAMNRDKRAAAEAKAAKQGGRRWL